MTNSSYSSQNASELLHQAVVAVKTNDRASARHFAQAALQTNPYLELAWLILAAVSPAPAARAYLEKALSLLPNSERLKRAYSQLENSSTSGIEGNAASGNRINTSAHSENDISDEQNVNQSIIQPEPTLHSEDKSNKKRSKLLLHAVTFTFVVLITILAVVLLKPTLVSAFFPDESIINRPESVYVKPTRTPTVTPTTTLTPTLAPTFTCTPTVEPTPTATSTAEPTSTAVAEVLPTSQIALYEDRWIDIDLSDQMVYAYEDDVLVNSFLVSTGTIYTPTVTGQFYIYVKYEAADMSGPGYYLPAVPYVMYFYQDYGIHAATWHNNFGTPMSHGCINMRLEDAEWIYNWASVGTLVNIHE